MVYTRKFVGTFWPNPNTEIKNIKDMYTRIAATMSSKENGIEANGIDKPQGDVAPKQES